MSLPKLDIQDLAAHGGLQKYIDEQPSNLDDLSEMYYFLLDYINENMLTRFAYHNFVTYLKTHRHADETISYYEQLIREEKIPGKKKKRWFGGRKLSRKISKSNKRKKSTKKRKSIKKRSTKRRRPIKKRR